MSNAKKIFGLIILFFSMTGCVSVKGFEKMYLSDDDMNLNERKLEYYEINIETYREGSSGANGGKTGGGCGCN